MDASIMRQPTFRKSAAFEIARSIDDGEGGLRGGGDIAEGRGDGGDEADDERVIPGDTLRC